MIVTCTAPRQPQLQMTCEECQRILDDQFCSLIMNKAFNYSIYLTHSCSFSVARSISLQSIYKCVLY